MPTTTCELGGASYQLDYSKMSSKRGFYYWGNIHTSPPSGFAFTALTSGGNVFDDAREPEHRQQAITKAIRDHEASNGNGL